ncbi:MAG TPA: ABC-F family ATP-binding cassette domain-containing protein [Planctomycetota bacterium]|nr:ABC-F family ATP-binding cassette domain-containing protein [Planctomycetota bacterium]
MSLLAASKLGKQVGARFLFRDAEFTLAEGVRVGLIGANGTGKTSLFRVILGDDDHEGTLSKKRGLRIAALEQDPRFPEGCTVREAVVSSDPEIAALERELREIHHKLEHSGDETDRLLSRLSEVETRFESRGGYEVEHRADKILEGIGFPAERHDEMMATLSGGERGRVAFARLLMMEPDLWLLDEPTNHLDIDGILFLEQFLIDSQASAILVSHDRTFLDRLSHETWEIEAGKFWQYPAPYTRARFLRDERIKAARREYDNQATFIDKESEYIRRYGAGQRARQAAGRLKRLERLDRLQRPEERARVMDLNLSAGESPGAKILKIQDLQVGYGPRVLFKDLNLELARGEVIGVAGPNGAGKTSFLKVLLDELPPQAGVVQWGGRVRKGVLSQHEHFDDEDTTPYKYLRQADPMRTEQQLRNLLGAMLFIGNDVDKPVRVLSGGERKRLMLTRLLIEGNNVLLLDEPTNHLDVPSREALELALAVYEGTLIVISHDRYFVEQVADRMLWIEGGEAHLTEGGFAQALEKREKRKALAAAKPKPDPSKKPVVVSAPPPSAAVKAATRFSKLKTQELESRIMATEERLKVLQEAFAKPEVYLNAGKTRDVKDEEKELRAELAALETEYQGRRE